MQYSVLKPCVYLVSSAEKDRSRGGANVLDIVLLKLDALCRR